MALSQEQVVDRQQEWLRYHIMQRENERDRAIRAINEAFASGREFHVTLTRVAAGADPDTHYVVKEGPKA